MGYARTKSHMGRYLDNFVRETTGNAPGNKNLVVGNTGNTGNSVKDNNNYYLFTLFPVFPVFPTTKILFPGAFPVVSRIFSQGTASHLFLGTSKR